MSNWDKNGNQITLVEMFDIWDKGEFAYDDVQKDLLLLKEGQVLGDLLKNCTICPVGNGTCNIYFIITISGFNPDKGHQNHKLLICPLGVENIERCPLSK